MLSDFYENNIYIIDMFNFECNVTCLTAINEDSWLWHRLLGHVSFDHLSRIDSKRATGSIKGSFS